MDLCVSQNVGCDDQRFWGIAILVVIGAFAVVQIVWAYWSAHRERQKTHRPTMAVKSYRGQRELYEFSRRRQSHASPAKKTERWPLKGLDRILGAIYSRINGSISGW